MKSPIALAALALVSCSLSAVAREPGATACVTVDPAAALGPIRDMNSVNGGPIVAPVLGDQKFGNFEDFRALKIPMGRTHDVINGVSGGAHTCDITALFPNFDADENDPKNYDFVFTDWYLDSMVRAGTKPFFRLGQTIEHGPKKYGALRPKDYAKWARICEHVIRHYNEGWGWGVDTARTTKNIAYSNQFGIVYWEIWNEPDIDPVDDPAKLTDGPRCWDGTVTNYFEFYEVAARHLKGKFPHLKIGGPALCGTWDVGKRFLDWCRDRKVPLDFFSWHAYAFRDDSIPKRVRHWRRYLDERGFTKTESILNEWNYVKGWVDDWVYSLEVERGIYNPKCAAFIAATMVDCQNAPLDHLMFYDVRPGGMNGVFDFTTAEPLHGYYPFYAWAKLAALGTQVKCDIRVGRGKVVTAATGVKTEAEIAQEAEEGFHAVAARGANGTLGVLVVRYSDDNNVTDTATVTFSVPRGYEGRTPRVHVTDVRRLYTEVTPFLVNGAWRFFLKPNAFAFVEF